jgi:hypothetical protein
MRPFFERVDLHVEVSPVGIYRIEIVILCLTAQQLCKYKCLLNYPLYLNLNSDSAILRRLALWMLGGRVHLETVAPPVLGKEFEWQLILAGMSLDSAGLFFAAASHAADSRNLQKTPPLQARPFILQEEGFPSSLPSTMAQGP